MASDYSLALKALADAGYNRYQRREIINEGRVFEEAAKVGYGQKVRGTPSSAESAQVIEGKTVIYRDDGTTKVIKNKEQQFPSSKAIPPTQNNEPAKFVPQDPNAIYYSLDSLPPKQGPKPKEQFNEPAKFVPQDPRGEYVPIENVQEQGGHLTVLKERKATNKEIIEAARKQNIPLDKIDPKSVEEAKVTEKYEMRVGRNANKVLPRPEQRTYYYEKKFLEETSLRVLNYGKETASTLYKGASEFLISKIPFGTEIAKQTTVYRYVPTSEIKRQVKESENVKSFTHTAGFIGAASIPYIGPVSASVYLFNRAGKSFGEFVTLPTATNAAQLSIDTVFAALSTKPAIKTLKSVKIARTINHKIKKGTIITSDFLPPELKDSSIDVEIRVRPIEKFRLLSDTSQEGFYEHGQASLMFKLGKPETMNFKQKPPEVVGLIADNAAKKFIKQEPVVAKSGQEIYLNDIYLTEGTKQPAKINIKQSKGEVIFIEANKFNKVVQFNDQSRIFEIRTDYFQEAKGAGDLLSEGTATGRVFGINPGGNLIDFSPEVWSPWKNSPDLIKNYPLDVSYNNKLSLMGKDIKTYSGTAYGSYGEPRGITGTYKAMEVYVFDKAKPKNPAFTSFVFEPFNTDVPFDRGFDLQPEIQKPDSTASQKKGDGVGQSSSKTNVVEQEIDMGNGLKTIVLQKVKQEVRATKVKGPEIRTKELSVTKEKTKTKQKSSTKTKSKTKTATQQAQAVQQVMGTKTRVATATKSKTKTSTATATGVGVAISVGVATSTATATGVGVATSTAIATGTSVGVATSTATGVGVATSTATGTSVTTTITKQKIRTMPPRTPPPRETIRKFPPEQTTIIKPPRIPDFQRDKRYPGFNVEVRRFGKFRKVNKQPLNRLSALGLGEDILRNTAAATFRLVPTGQKGIDLKKKPKNLQAFRFKTSSSGDMYIQRLNQRIKTSGEVKEISLAPRRKK